jgi:GNAT superfamily N-acetyltransferase
VTDSETVSHTIRALQPDDAAAWSQCRLEALTSHPLMFSSAPPRDSSELTRLFQARVAQHESLIIGAIRDGQLEGTVGVVRQQGEKERHKALVWGVYVAPAARRIGVGRALLQAAIDSARTWCGVEQLHLSVSDVPGNPTPLYTQVGFVAWGHEPRALVWNGIDVDETHMVLDLRVRIRDPHP